MMPALSLMYPESLPGSADELAQNQHGVLPASSTTYQVGRRKLCDPKCPHHLHCLTRHFQVICLLLKPSSEVEEIIPGQGKSFTVGPSGDLDSLHPVESFDLFTVS